MLVKRKMLVEEGNGTKEEKYLLHSMNWVFKYCSLRSVSKRLKHRVVLKCYVPWNLVTNLGKLMIGVL